VGVRIPDGPRFNSSRYVLTGNVFGGKEAVFEVTIRLLEMCTFLGAGLNKLEAQYHQFL